MKRVEVWPAAYWIFCEHRNYSTPTVYEIEWGDLERYGPTGDITVVCPDCGMRHFLERVAGVNREALERAMADQERVS